MDGKYGRIAPPLPPKSKTLASHESSFYDVRRNENDNSCWTSGESSQRCSARASPPRVEPVVTVSSPSVIEQSGVDSRTFTKKSYSLNSRNGKGVVGKIASAFSEPRRKDNGFKIITWADKNQDTSKNLRKNDDEFFYQNVSNNGTNYIEYKLKNIINKEGKQNRQASMKTYEDGLGKSRLSYKVTPSNDVEKTESLVSPTWMTASTRQIQVHQVKNKTVVKISINDRSDVPSQIQESNFFKPLNDDDLTASEYQYPELLFKKKPKSSGCNEYAEPYRGDPSKAVQLYANVDLSKKRKNQQDGQIYENTDAAEDSNGQVYMNVSNGDAYANLESNDTPLVQEHHYLNVNGTATTEAVPLLAPDDGDQVYENEDFTVLRNSQVTQSIIQKNELPIKEDVYENTEFMTKNNILDTICFSGPGIGEHEGYQTPNSSLRLVVSDNADMLKTKKKYIIDNGSCEDSMDNGQYSPVDTFDSGTCSDPENMSTLSINEAKVIVTVGAHNEMEERGHKRAESITSSGVGVDSEVSDTEESNISCDSLNSNDLHACSVSEDHGYHTPTSENKTASPVECIEYQNIKTPSPEPIGRVNNSVMFDVNRNFECDGTDIIKQVASAAERLKSLRLENTNLYLARRVEACEDVYENCNIYDSCPRPDGNRSFNKSVEPYIDKDSCDDALVVKTLPQGLLKDIQSRNVRILSAYPKGEKDNEKLQLPKDVVSVFQSPKQTAPLSKTVKIDEKRVVISERTYEDRRKIERICGLDVDTDKFYKFHLCENTVELPCEKQPPEDETFAGYRDYLSRDRAAAITSAKGTIRGVKNRVKAGIATFLQLQENKVYKDKDAGKIVVYSTTMGIVRETYQKCLKVKQILKTLMVKFEERDVFMSSEAQEEIRDRMKCDAILVPQVFVEGQHIGDAETIERLNESGELRKILKPYKSAEVGVTCNVCGGYRLLPCRVCKGSKKSVHRNHFTAEFVSLKCMNCDPVGLMKCYAC